MGQFCQARKRSSTQAKTGSGMVGTCHTWGGMRAWWLGLELELGPCASNCHGCFLAHCHSPSPGARPPLGWVNGPIHLQQVKMWQMAGVEM